MNAMNQPSTTGSQTNEGLIFEARLTHDLLESTHLSVWEAYRRSVARWPDRPAVSMGGEEWTYQELHDRSLRSAAALASLGITKGSRVAFLINACPEWLVLHYALARLGAIGVPVNLVYEAVEVRHVLQLSQAELVISMEAFRGVDYAERLRLVDPTLVDGSLSVDSLPSIKRVVSFELDAAERPIARHGSTNIVFGDCSEDALGAASNVASSDPAYIIFTSGSTAKPKAALCAHRALVGCSLGMARSLDLDHEDRFLGMLPAFHVGGIVNAVGAPHAAGACTVLTGAFSADRAVQVIEEERCTATVGFDTMFTKMHSTEEFETTDTTSLTKVALAATPAYLRHIRTEWGLTIAAGIYGSTESGALVSAVPPWLMDSPAMFESNGRPLPGVEVIVRNPDTQMICAAGEAGEICFRGWNRVIEYYDDAEATAAAIDGDGYFSSGDYGYLDADGNLYYRGRYKMMIKTGGENVSEREVEIFLENEVEGIEFAQVVGVPDETWGEAVFAFVQLSQEVSSEELRDRTRGKIARFKIPKRFHRLDASEFPTLSNGRPDKHALRALAAEVYRP